MNKFFPWVCTSVVLSTGIFQSDAVASSGSIVEQRCVDKMVAWELLGKATNKDALETTSETLERYKSIARDAISVVYDPTETPLFSGPQARAKTLATVLSVASTESHFRRDVDFGIGEQSKGDHGRSWCLMQIQLGREINGKTRTRIVLNDSGYSFTRNPSEGLGGEDLVADRKSCFRAALHMMRVSLRTCSHLPPEERLSVYASGNCISGRKASRIKMNRANYWLRSSAPPVNDAEAISDLVFNDNVVALETE